MIKDGKRWRLLHLATLKTVTNAYFNTREDTEVYLKYHHFYLNISTGVILSKITEWSQSELDACEFSHIIPIQNCEFDVVYMEKNE